MRNISEFFFLKQWFRRRWRTKYAYIELWWPICSVERCSLCNYVREHYKKHLCELVLNLEQWFRRKCGLK